MKRVYHSIFATVVRSLCFLKDRLAAKKEAYHVSLPGRFKLERQVAKALFIALVVSLLASSSPPALSTIARLVSEGRPGMASWLSPNKTFAKLFRDMADSYARYRSWVSPHALAKQHEIEIAVSAPQSPSYSASTASISVAQPMIPLPPDAPPVFTNDPLEVGVTVVQALHISELRDAVNVVRARAGLAAAAWDPTFPVASGLPIKATHILELRTRLDEARTALGLPAASYSPPAPSIGGPIRKAHVQEIRDCIKGMLGSTVSGDATVARLDPANETGDGGENPLSRNYNWSVPLVGLAGRNGLNLGLSLSYNSLVWTKHGSSISFNDDGGFPSPGFRLGFPVIQPLYYNSEVGKYAFLLITPDGGRTELRQVNASALYEAADSSHLLLDTGTTMVLHTTDGTQLSYAWMGSDYQCTQIKDRNGNYITVNYTAFGRISTVVDTLGRVITFNYDGTNYLTSITQLWNGQLHYWARFEYNPAAEIHTAFQGLTNLGPQNGSTIKELSKVTLDDDSRFEFDYTYWGQIWKIRNHAADGHLLNYRAYNLPGGWETPQTDCPRFTIRVDWAENWNRSGPNGTSGLPGGAEQEVQTASWIVPASASWNLPDGTPQTGTLAKITAADGTYNNIYFEGSAGTSNGWKRGLPSLVETYDSGNVRQRQSVTAWTQDNTGLSYPFNPRVTETNIYDPAGNRARTSVTYQTVTLANGTSCRLPQNVYEYQANAATILRRSHTDYNLATIYTDRRILGLVSEKTLYEVDPNTGAETLMSKVAPAYDEAGSIQGTAAPIQHDNTNYGAGFVGGRANLSSVKRYDVINTSQFTLSTLKYNTAGAAVSAIDPLSHQVTVNYADSFSDGNNGRNTLAYPTTITDADGFASTSQYNFDFGAVTRTQSPPPQGQSVGAIKNFTYDSVARLQKVAIEFGGNTDYSHTSFDYPASQTRVDTYTTIQEGLGEAHSFQISDGVGRVIATAADHPGSIGGFSGQLMLYDIMGRGIKQSNPTETNASGVPTQWVTAGDDAQAGWLYTQQTFDWKGRPLVTTNTDLTTKEASYAGCGCAGGEVVTLTDEGTLVSGAKKRQQKIYTDVLGRTVKTEILNWDGPGPFGTGGTVYSATVNSYNARDQVTRVRQFQGPDTSGTYQDTVITYDGYARRKTSHAPEQQVDPNNGSSTDHTTWDYNTDDTVQKITDPRGASESFSYNPRRLVTAITYAAPAGITATANVSHSYDPAGNRTSMSDGMGSMSYGYDQLSRLTSETRTITGIGTYPLSYTYNLAGAMASITDPFGAQISYNFDGAGRVASVTGSAFAGVSNYTSNTSNIQYRAWGGQKSVTYGDNKSATTSYDARMRPSAYDFPGLREQFQYYADGRLQQMTDLDDRNQDIGYPDTARHFSRARSYDQLGRLTSDKGATVNTFPFNQNYAHDAFNNLTSRYGTYYYQTQTSDSASFSNNRRQNWNYYADGQVKHSPLAFDVNFNESVYRDWSYDAAGRMVQVQETITNPSSVSTYTTSYDGDGQPVRESITTATYNTTGYMIRSSVLDEVVTRLDSAGAKQKTIVNVDGMLMAVQSSVSGFNFVLWTHIDPLGMSEAGDTKPAYDPLGNYVPWQHAPTAPPDAYPPFSPNYGGLGSLFGSAQDKGCVLNGLPISCSDLSHQIDIGNVAADYLIMDSQGLRHVPGDVVPLGLGMFAINYPKSDNEGWHWGETISALQQNPDDDWMNNDPDSIENTTPNCSIKVAFRGSSGFLDIQNGSGIRSDKLEGGGGYGLGFTVSGSVTRGEIGGVETPTGTEIVNPHGSWTIQQYVANSTRQTFEKTGDFVFYRGSATKPDGPSAPARKIQGNKFSYADFPGPSKNYGEELGNLTGYVGEWDFAVKVIDGKQQCDVKFHISMTLNHGKWTAHWGSR
jgi:YD repeat-containing protein